MTNTIRLLSKLMGIFIITICGFLFLVPLFGFGWHLFHRNYISFVGWKIPIPNDYYVRQGSRGPSIWRLSFGRPFFDTPYSHVSFLGGEQFGNKYSAPFEEAMSESAAKEGFQLRSKYTVALGVRTASCLEFARVGKQPEALVRCAARGTDIYVFFEGDARYVPELFAILKSMSEEASNQNTEGKI